MEVAPQQKAKNGQPSPIEEGLRSTQAEVRAGRALLEQRRYEEALVAFRKAVEMAPENASLHRDLGNILFKLRRYEEALGCYREAIEINSQDHTNYHNLATGLKNLGKFDEAAENYRKALEIRPDCFGSLRQFASMKQFSDNDSDLALIERGAASTTLSEDERIDLHFTLAKAYDDLNQYDKAFDKLQSANQLSRKTFTYRPEMNRDFIDRVINVFDKEFFEARRDFGNPSERPIFILGMPRSGTTLTEQIIASHPDVYGAGELIKMHGLTSGIAKRFRTKVNYPEAMRVIDKMAVGALAQDYLDHLESLNCEALRVSDKFPFNYRMMGFLALAFPNAKIIRCKRDPLDTCLSCYSVRFKDSLNFSYDLQDLGQYYRDYERLMAHWREVLPITWLDVQYEDLVVNQEEETRRLIAFCGLDWNDACLEFHKTERPILTASSWQARQPLYTSSAGRWRNYDKHLTPLKQVLDLQPAARQGEVDNRTGSKDKRVSSRNTTNATPSETHPTFKPSLSAEVMASVRLVTSSFLKMLFR